MSRGATQMVNKVKCPVCGKELELVPHKYKLGRVAAYCNCGRGRERAVVERPAPVENKAVPKPDPIVEKEG